MNPMYRVKIPQPKRVHVLLSKACGGFMVFWMLWRGYHDWPMLFSHFEADKVWKIPDQDSKHH